MAITYTWNCHTVDTYPTHSDSQDPENTQNDVVYNVHWSLSGQMIHNDVTQSSSVIGTQTISTDNLSSFVSFDDLTHDEVVAWTTGSMLSQNTSSVDNLKASVSSSINQKIYPVSVTKYIQ